MAPRLRKKPEIAEDARGPKGFVASASQVALASESIKRAFKRQEWQQECWEKYDEIGEYRYAMAYGAMAASRATLVVEQQQPDGSWDEMTSGPARAYLDEVLDGCGGESQFLYTLFLHLQVPGESFVVGTDVVDEATGVVIDYRWRIVEAGEIDTDANPATIVDPETGEKQKLGDSALIVRVWRPHPRDAAKADSASHAALPALREIEHISKHIAATVDSRLAGNGLLLLPNEVSITTADGVTVNGNSQSDTEDPFMQTLVQSMINPISDRDSAAAVVPVVARMPGQFIQFVKHITFGTNFDAQAQPLRDAAVKRLALTLDMPPEQLLGLGDTNHWSAWQISEEGVKTGIEPGLQLICDAITRQLLRPLLGAQFGKAAAMGYRVWYSVQALVQRPNHTADADAAFDRHAIGYTAYRSSKGFDEADAPDEQELRMQLMAELVKMGKIDPVTGAYLALPSTAVDKSTPGDQGIVPAPQPGEEPNGLPEQPSQSPSQSPDAAPGPGPSVQSSGLLAAAEALVLRALERAGNKRRTHRDQTQLASVPDHETHLHLPVAESDVPRLLTNAWSLVPSIARRHQVDAERLQTALTALTGSLLTAGRPFDDEAHAHLERLVAQVPTRRSAA